ncbi:hypothetical protein ACOMHN_031292 [Nucella lapillus]
MAQQAGVSPVRIFVTVSGSELNRNTSWRKTFRSLLEKIFLTPHPGGGNAVVLSLHKSGEPELHLRVGYRGSRPAPPLLRSRISPCSADRRVDPVPPRRLPHRLAFNR